MGYSVVDQLMHQRSAHLELNNGKRRSGSAFKQEVACCSQNGKLLADQRRAYKRQYTLARAQRILKSASERETTPNETVRKVFTVQVKTQRPTPTTEPLHEQYSQFQFL